MLFFVYRDLDDNYVICFYLKNVVWGRRKEFVLWFLIMIIYLVLGLWLLLVWCFRVEIMIIDGVYLIDVGFWLLVVIINLMVGL